MNIDQKIQQLLQQEEEKNEVPEMYKSGLIGMIMPAFQGAMRRWVILVNLVIMLASGLLVWSGYEFFTAPEPDLFWGICFIAALQTQIALKQWLWQEIHRSNLLMEIKRLKQSSD